MVAGADFVVVGHILKYSYFRKILCNFAFIAVSSAALLFGAACYFYFTITTNSIANEMRAGVANVAADVSQLVETVCKNALSLMGDKEIASVLLSDQIN